MITRARRGWGWSCWRCRLRSWPRSISFSTSRPAGGAHETGDGRSLADARSPHRGCARLHPALSGVAGDCDSAGGVPERRRVLFFRPDRDAQSERDPVDPAGGAGRGAAQHDFRHLRGLGEFGAVTVLAGSVDDKMTMPLQIEQYYLDLDQGLPKAFALASILLLLSIVTLAIKIGLEWRHRAQAHLVRPE